MKRKELIRHLRAHGCQLLREGKRHSWWWNPALNRRSAFPGIMKSVISWRTRSALTLGYRQQNEVKNSEVRKYKQNAGSRSQFESGAASTRSTQSR
jgi:hypothetical protein